MPFLLQLLTYARSQKNVRGRQIKRSSHSWGSKHKSHTAKDANKSVDAKLDMIPRTHMTKATGDYRSTGSYRQTTSGSGNHLRYVWRPVQCSGSVMLACLEAGKGGKSGLSLAQGGSAEDRSGCRPRCAGFTKPPPAHQLCYAWSCVLHGWCTTHSNHSSSVPWVSQDNAPRQCTLEEGESHPDKMVWWNGNILGWKRCITWNGL